MRLNNKEIKSIKPIEEKDHVIYSDTDSIFLSALPVIQSKYPNIDTSASESNKEMVKLILQTASDVQSHVNSTYNVMAKKMFNVDKHTFEIKQEIISTTGFWLAKKRYAQWRINENGKDIREDNKKMEIKGIDVVRSSFPYKFRIFLSDVLKSILAKKSKEEIDKMVLDFRANLKNLSIKDVAKNTSVNFVSRDGKLNYNPKTRNMFNIVTGTPAQAKSAIYYNDLLKKYKLTKNIESIHSGMKIKWVYMKENPYNVDCLAFKADDTDPKEIMDFIEMYIDKKKLYEKELKSKLEDFYKVLQWDFPNVNQKTSSKFFL